MKELKDGKIVENEVIDSSINTLHNLRDGLAVLDKRFNLIQMQHINKNMFLVYNGVLREFKIKQQVIFPLSYVPSSDINSATLIHIAGIGKLWVSGVNFVGCFGMLPFDCYASVEDFKNDKPLVLDYNVITSNDIAYMYSAAGVCSFNVSFLTHYSRIYKWDGVKAVCSKRRDNISLAVIWDGILLSTKTPKIEKPYYFSEKNCIEDNSINVLCFADDEDENNDDEDETVEINIKVSKADLNKVLELAAEISY